MAVHRNLTRRSLVAAPFLAASRPRVTSAQSSPPAPPDILVFLLDDADTDDMRTLPTANDEVGGTLFPNFILTDPLCGPARASILTGQYAHNTGVRDNIDSWARFQERTEGTVFTALAARDYRTVYIGKFMNQYREEDTIPGVSANYARTDPDQYFYDRDYSTDIYRDQAIAEITDLPATVPLFLMIGFKAPHQPYLPAPRHENAPVGKVASKVQRQRRRTLLSVDEAISDIRVAMGKRWDNALVILLTDNGYIFPGEGQGDVIGKGVWYDQAIRVQANIRFPGVGGGTDARLAANIDIAPTIIRAAGAEAEVDWAIDGRALQDATARTSILISGRMPATPRFPDAAAKAGDALSAQSIRAGLIFDGIKQQGAVYVQAKRRGGGKRSWRNEYYVRGKEGVNRSDNQGKAKQKQLKARLNAFRVCQGDTCRAAGLG